MKKLIKITSVVPSSSFYHKANQLIGKVAWIDDIIQISHEVFSARMRFLCKTGIYTFDNDPPYSHALFGFAYEEVTKGSNKNKKKGAK